MLGQSFQDFEVIVVDDGSTDDTRSLISQYAAIARGRLRYRWQPHHSVARARNHGTRCARGEFIAFLDSDDAWLPEKLRRQVDYLRATQAGFVHTSRTLTLTPGCARSKMLPYPQEPAQDSAHLLAATSNVAMTVMVRREVLDAVGGFDESLKTTQDLELWLRIAKCYDLGFIDHALVQSYKLPDSNMAANAEQTYADRIRVLTALASDAHPLVIRRNWSILLARHCYHNALLKIRRGKLGNGVYWMIRALASLRPSPPSPSANEQSNSRGLAPESSRLAGSPAGGSNASSVESN